MIQITTSFLEKCFGAKEVTGNKMLEQKFEQVMYLFKGTYPSIQTGNHSLTMALSAMGFLLNAEVYFDRIDPRKGKDFFASKRSEFLKYYDFQNLITEIHTGDQVLFLYERYSSAGSVLSTNGVIGKFHSIECIDNYDNPHGTYDGDKDTSVVVVKLEISNKGVIDLPVVDLAYFGKWDVKLELIM